MRTLIIWILCLFVWSGAANGADGPTYYERFRNVAEEQRRNLREEGLGYMIGGGVGFATSLGLGLTSEELVPKIGYSLIQTLSAAAFYYGAVSYYEGDKLTREADRLAEMDRIMSKDPSIKEKSRKEALNQMTMQIIQQEKRRVERVRKVRGYVALSTAVSSGLTMVISKSDSTTSNISLGFIFLISSVGAASDLFFPAKPSSVKELFAFEPYIGTDRWAGTLTFRW